MELICLGSSSSGNCYLLRGDRETMVIENGIPIQQVKRALGWTLRPVAGCLVSHEHKDHAKYISDFMRNGIRVLALKEVFESQNIKTRPFATEIEPMKGYKVGGFKVFALPVEHDVPCLGFVIEHPEMGKTLFVTDTMMIQYRIEGLNHIMIEANYSDEILQENMDNGVVPHSLRDRLMHSHMEIKTTAGVLRQTDLSAVSEIVLLHLSGNNSNAVEFRDEIAGVSGKPTYVARPGMTIDFSKEPY